MVATLGCVLDLKTMGRVDGEGKQEGGDLDCYDGGKRTKHQYHMACALDGAMSFVFLSFYLFFFSLFCMASKALVVCVRVCVCLGVYVCVFNRRVE